MSEATRTNDNVTRALPLSSWAALTAAVGFLTRIPVGSAAATSSKALAGAPQYFPLVGALIGLGTSAVIAASGQLWPIWLGAIIAVAAEAWLTGALHEDAWADFCDAFGGGWNREQTLTILRDSRLGTYGALGLGLAVTLRVGALVALLGGVGLEEWPVWVSAIVASACLGRWSMVLAMVWLPIVPRRESLAQGVGGRLGLRDLAIATLWALPAAVLFAAFDPRGALLALFFVSTALVWFARLVRRRLGGITGDCAGAIGYLVNVLILLAAAAEVGA
jgi:adenosylcobinamide-GDP ribazoletransferase